MIRSKVRVAFIAGAGFSGSTLLEESLSQVEGCVSIGGLHPMFEHYWPMMICECGKEHRDCEFWQGVLEDAYGGPDEQAAKRERARGARQGLHRPLAPVGARELVAASTRSRRRSASWGR